MPLSRELCEALQVIPAIRDHIPQPGERWYFTVGVMGLPHSAADIPEDQRDLWIKFYEDWVADLERGGAEDKDLARREREVGWQKFCDEVIRYEAQFLPNTPALVEFIDKVGGVFLAEAGPWSTGRWGDPEHHCSPGMPVIHDATYKSYRDVWDTAPVHRGVPCLVWCPTLAELIAMAEEITEQPTSPAQREKGRLLWGHPRLDHFERGRWGFGSVIWRDSDDMQYGATPEEAIAKWILEAVKEE